MSVLCWGILALEDNLRTHSTLVLESCVTQEAFHLMPLIAAEADCNIPPCNPFLILWFYRKSFYTKLSWLVAKLGKKMQKPHPDSSCHTPPLLLFSFQFNPKCKHPSARGRMNPVRTFHSPCLGPTGEQSEGICGYLYLWWVLDVRSRYMQVLKFKQIHISFALSSNMIASYSLLMENCPNWGEKNVTFCKVRSN